MAEAIRIPETHRYPAYSGMNLFRRRCPLVPGAFAWTWTQSEVLTLIGSKEGIAHLPLGINNPEDINLMTSPGYPVYQMGTLFAGAYCHFLPLTRENRFLPDLRAIPPLVARDAKAFFFNYPNNPTAAVADKEFFARVVDYCRRRLLRSTTLPTPNWPSTDSSPQFLERPGPKRSASSSIRCPRPTT
jgi:LL-diaminopimelate aminotransferase